MSLFTSFKNGKEQINDDGTYMKVNINNIVLSSEEKISSCYLSIFLHLNNDNLKESNIHKQEISELPETSKLVENIDVQSNSNQNMQTITIQANEKGKFITQKDFIFICYPKSQISFHLQFKNKKGELRKGYSIFPLSSLYKIPRVRHLLDIQLIDETTASEQNQISPTAQIEAQIILIPGMIGAIQMFMIQGKLERDTELIGQMDPYVKIIVDGIQYATNVAQEAGKNPVWNIKLKIPIPSVNTKFHVKVLDQDLVKDDLVGQKIIDLFSEGFLIPTKKMISHPVYIFDQNKKGAGKLFMESRFILNQSII